MPSFSCNDVSRVIRFHLERSNVMASFNKITIVGYLGRDPELRYTPQGTPVCDFSVATTERRKDKSGDTQEVTTWFRVSMFGRQAEIASQYLSKGRQVYIEGQLSQREWTDKEGAARTSLEVRGTDIQFLSPASEGEQTQVSTAKATAATAGESKRSLPAKQKSNRIQEDEIPF
jgi:single-strand DNA-binding protein